MNLICSGVRISPTCIIKHVVAVVVSLQVLRQEHIRGLIKGNSTAKTELIRLHTEVGCSPSMTLLASLSQKKKHFHQKKSYFF